MTRKHTLTEVAQLQTLVKRANQRLRQLEKSGISKSSVAYQKIQSQAYGNDLFFSTTSKGQFKFNTNINKLSVKDFKKLKSKVETFLNAKTSTVSGVKKSQNKAYSTYKNKTGSKMSFKEFGEFWSSGIVQQHKMAYGSEQTELIRQTIEDNDSLTLEDVESVLKNGGLTQGYNKVNATLDTISNNEELINLFIDSFGMSRNEVINGIAKHNGSFEKF